MSYVNLMKEHMYRMLVLGLGLMLVLVGSAVAAPLPQGNAILQAPGEVRFSLEQQDGAYLLKGDTLGLRPQEYPVVFAMYGLTDWRGYDAVSFEVRNNSRIPVTPVFAVKLSPLVVLKPMGPCLWQEDGARPLVVMPADGGVVVLPGQRGKLLIPFSSLQFRGKNYPISYFTSWNVQFNTPPDAEVEVCLEKFLLYPQGERIVSDTRAAPLIAGENFVQAPPEGTESIAVYRVDKEMMGEFRLSKPYEGVAITADGRLTVTSAATPQVIRIIAMLPNGQGVAKEVAIKPTDKEWFGSVLSADKESLLSFMLKYETYLALRWMILALMLAMGAVYIHGIRKERSIGGKNSL